MPYESKTASAPSMGMFSRQTPPHYRIDPHRLHQPARIQESPRAPQAAFAHGRLVAVPPDGDNRSDGATPTPSQLSSRYPGRLATGEILRRTPRVVASRARNDALRLARLRGPVHSHMLIRQRGVADKCCVNAVRLA